MNWIVSARGFVVLLLLGAGAVCAQSTLPATGPTALPAGSPQTSDAPTALPPDSARRAVVLYSGGQLEIAADNSSLNQILREICRVTGMKITGGVTDERVFGKYGPGTPAEILVKLLDGTGSNVLLRQTASKVPTELILTARQGGPTPPNPNARGFDDDAQANEQQGQMPVPNQRVPQAAAGASGSVPSGQMPGQSPVLYQPPPLTTGGENPGLTPSRTPQQVYEQLQQLQQAQPQQAPTTHP